MALSKLPFRRGLNFLIDDVSWQGVYDMERRPCFLAIVSSSSIVWIPLGAFLRVLGIAGESLSRLSSLDPHLSSDDPRLVKTNMGDSKLLSAPS
jgi:hypothetical protein